MVLNGLVGSALGVMACQDFTTTSAGEYPLFGEIDPCAGLTGARAIICDAIFSGMPDGASTECDDLRSWYIGAFQAEPPRVFGDYLPGGYWAYASEIGYDENNDGEVQIDTVNFPSMWADSVGISLRHEFMHIRYAVPDDSVGNEYADSVGRVWCY
jgi:hypothetical protein